MIGFCSAPTDHQLVVARLTEQHVSIVAAKEKVEISATVAPVATRYERSDFSAQYERMITFARRGHWRRPARHVVFDDADRLEGDIGAVCGRLHRQHDGKKDVLVVDYVDNTVPVLARMAAKRRMGTGRSAT